MANLIEKGGYTDIPRTVSDPGDWVVVNDGTQFDYVRNVFGQRTHPFAMPTWGLGSFVQGRDGIGAPRGFNAGTVDGSLT